MSAITVCDICGLSIDRTEMIHLRVDDARTIGSTKGASMDTLRRLLDEATRRYQERVTRTYDLHVACFEERIKPVLP